MHSRQAVTALGRSAKISPFQMIPPSFFPNMPNEVREMWLDSIAEGHGWDFESIEDSTDNTSWRYALNFRTLKEINSYTWTLSEIDLASASLSESSIQCVEGLIIQHVRGIPTSYANLFNSKERFNACADYIKDTGTIPRPIVSLDLGKGYEVLDGSHRLAALFSVNPPNGYVIPSWIANETK